MASNIPSPIMAVHSATPQPPQAPEWHSYSTAPAADLAAHYSNSEPDSFADSLWQDYLERLDDLRVCQGHNLPHNGRFYLEHAVKLERDLRLQLPVVQQAG